MWFFIGVAVFVIVAIAIGRSAAERARLAADLKDLEDKVEEEL